jgi:purine-binding chemotaxis protein CheW
MRDVKTAVPDRRQLMTFSVGDASYGLPVEQVLEVLNDRPLTPVPLAPRSVAGLMNLRGQVVPAIDLARRLEVAAAATGGRKQMNVVIRHGESVVSLLVDEIGDVVDVEEAAFQQPPETLRGSARDLIHGAYRLEDGLLLLLDATEILDLEGESASC